MTSPNADLLIYSAVAIAFAGAAVCAFMAWRGQRRGVGFVQRLTDEQREVVESGGLIRAVLPGPVRTLVVLEHGWRQTTRQWTQFVSLALRDEAYKGCDFFLDTYSRRIRARTGLRELGGALANSIGVEDLTHDYARIILIGYSIGGLIVRSCYLQAVKEAGLHPWVNKVSRIVLLATPNRGLGGRGLPVTRRLAVWLMRRLAGVMLRDVLRGSDFITSLRLEWVRVFSDPDINTPAVVQLLGVRDDYVGKEDSTDVTVFPDARLFMLANARHEDLAVFSGAADQKYRRIQLACFDDPRNDEAGEEDAPPPAPSAVVFQLHGIRDYGGWLSKFASAVVKVQPRARVVRPGFGFFSAFGFAIPWIRRRRIAWFCDCYTEEVARLGGNVDAVPFYFVGHSYGTYLLAQCLKRFPAMRFERVCLVGSVVTEEFDWREYFDAKGGACQIKGLRNDCATLDWPVAICCQVLRRLFRFRDLGVGGFRGFNFHVPEMQQNRWIQGNHSASLTDDATRESIVRYLFDGVASEQDLVHPPRWLSIASQLAPLAVCLVGAGLLVSAWLMISGLGWPVWKVATGFVTSTFVALIALAYA